MTTRRTQKIWLGVGAVALIGAGTAAHSAEPAASGVHAHGGKHAPVAQADAKPPQAAPGIESAKPAGEAGEAGESGSGAGLDIRVRFLRNMGLVRGHLLVGDELVRQGRWEDALPHFHHPVEELYKDIAPIVQGQGLRQFDTALKALSQTVQAKKAEAYAGAWKIVDQRMTAIDKAMAKLSTPLAKTTMQTVIAMLRSAASEYAEAIEDGRISKPVEYQDSRGFVWQAERLIDASAREFEKIDKVAIARVKSEFVELRKAWPEAVPPAKPLKDHTAVLDDIARIELAASIFLN